MNLKGFIKFCERRLHRIIYKVIYKNIYIYQLGVFLARYTNFLLPHEEDIYGLNYLNLDKKKYIIDVGASDGLYFKSVRSIGIENKFISFEPLKKNIKHLSTIKKKNKNFKFYTLALGNKNGLLTIYTPIYENKPLYNWSSYSKKESEKILKLRNFNINFNKLNFKKNKIKQKKLDFFKLKLTLLKLDVEGYEIKVLLGALQTIKKFKPIIYVENNLTKGKYNTVNFFNKRLSKFGYRPYIFNFEKKSFFKYNKDNIKGRLFSYNVYFVTKRHLN